MLAQPARQILKLPQFVVDVLVDVIRGWRIGPGIVGNVFDEGQKARFDVLEIADDDRRFPAITGLHQAALRSVGDLRIGA